jgi:hypothetical protein
MAPAFRTSLTAGLALALAAAAQEAIRFEVAAWVDHFDFQRHMDTETVEGWGLILDHVQETGATTILWRNCGGGTMRYASAIESHHHDSMLDKRRVPDSRAIGGWVRYGECEQDIIATVVRLCRERGLRPGVHWPFEETHFSGWTLGRFNLEHPQYWGRDASGTPWWGRCSLAYEPVVEHKLALVDELLARGIEVLFIDFWRSGGWSPAYEYVPPVVDRFRDLHGVDPPVNWKDPQWARHVAGYVTAWLRRLRERLAGHDPPVELAVGVPFIAPVSDRPIIYRGADWQAWVEEGLVDTLAVYAVDWDEGDPMGSTRQLYREVMETVAGRCRVLFPVQRYDFTKQGLPSYGRVTQRPLADIAAELMRLAWEEEAAGITLECVDYGNYDQATRGALRSLSLDRCRHPRPR